jgi:hypothetical protein
VAEASAVTNEIITVTLNEEREPALSVTVRPLGVFYGVFVDEHEEPLAVGKTELLARVRAYRTLTGKIHDIRSVVKAEGRATSLYKRLCRTLKALEGLERVA